MRRRYAEYRPSGRRSPRLPPLFRSVRLNAAGGTVVAVLCAAGAAAGWGACRLAGWPVAGGLAIGALSTLAALVAADRRAWGRLWTGYSWGAPPETTASAAAALRRLGLPVELATHPGGRVALRYRHRDRRRVATALERLGIRPPRAR